MKQQTLQRSPRSIASLVTASEEKLPKSDVTPAISVYPRNFIYYRQINVGSFFFANDASCFLLKSRPQVSFFSYNSTLSRIFVYFLFLSSHISDFILYSLDSSIQFCMSSRKFLSHQSQSIPRGIISFLHIYYN